MTMISACTTVSDVSQQVSLLSERLAVLHVSPHTLLQSIREKAATEGVTVSLCPDLIYLIMSFLIATLQVVYHSRNCVVKRQTLVSE
jgi:hypothetical protein